jgi:hypothetical protein
MANSERLLKGLPKTLRKNILPGKLERSTPFFITLYCQSVSLPPKDLNSKGLDDRIVKLITEYWCNQSVVAEELKGLTIIDLLQQKEVISPKKAARERKKFLRKRNS